VADQTITIRVNAITGQAQAQLLAVGKSTGQMVGRMDTAARSAQAKMQAFGSAAATFGKVVTLGVAGGLALSAKAAIDFESSFTGVRKTLDATEPQFQKLSDGIRDLAKEIPVSVNELNRIAELGGQLGISVGGIEGFTETIAKVGATTTVAADEAAISFARIANILGLGENQFSQLGSSLVDLGNNFATTEDQILTFALRIAPVGQTVGLTADQVLALATAFSSVGVPAERGGTAVQRTFIEIARAVQEGGATLDTFAEVAGVTVGEFSELFESDAAAALDLFLIGLGQVAAAGGNVFDVLDRVNLGNQRTVQALLAVANSSGILTEALETGASAFNEYDALTEEFDKRLETTASKLTIAKNQIVDLGIEIGTTLLPLIGDAAEKFQDFAAGIGAVDGPARALLKILAALIPALTISGIAGSKLTKIFGVFLPNAFKGATASAALLRGALGFGFLAAVGAVVKIITDIGTAARESSQRVDDLAEAVANVGSSNVRDLIIGGLGEKDRKLLDDLGISYKVFADAVLGNEVAQKILEDFLVIEDSTGAYLETADKAIQLQSLLTERTDEYTAALERQRQAAAQEVEQANLEAIAEGYESIDEKMREEALMNAASGITEIGDAADYTADELDELADQMEDAFDEFDSIIDASDNFIDSIVNLAEAQAELNDTTEPTFEQLQAVRGAFTDLTRAARDLGPEGIQPAIAQLDQMLLLGLLNEEQYLEFLNILLTMQPVANAFAGGADLIVGNMDAVAGAAEIAGVSVSEFINLLLGLDAAMLGTIQNAGNFAAAIGLANRAVQSGLGTTVFGAIAEDLGTDIRLVDQIARRIQELESGFVSIGGDIATAIGTGIRGGGGGGGGGGAGPIEEAVEDELEAALELIQSQLDAFRGAIDANRDYIKSIQELKDAEEELAELRREQADLPDQIAEAEERLQRAREDAARVTLDEQLAIEIAEENLARAQLAYAQGRISLTELQIAERELEEARADATGPTDEVAEAEEELEDLRQREIEIAEDLADAELALLDAQLALIDAQIDLVNAGRDFNELGRDGIDIFRALAEEVGLTAEAIERLIELGLGVEDVDSVLGGRLIPAISGGDEDDGAPTDPSSRTYTVKAGDTLGAIAARLGTSVSNLVALNGTVYNSLSGVSRSLDPDLIYPGDILKYALGGVVPGMLGQPQLAIVHGGEQILSPSATRRQHQLESQPIMIENLNLQGVFDPTRPQEWARIMRAVRNDLEYDRRSRGGR